MPIPPQLYHKRQDRHKHILLQGILGSNIELFLLSIFRRTHTHVFAEILTKERLAWEI